MPLPPPLHPGMFMRGGDQVQILPGWHHLIDHTWEL
jgi:hypothetical protein